MTNCWLKLERTLANRQYRISCWYADVWTDMSPIRWYSTRVHCTATPKKLKSVFRIIADIYFLFPGVPLFYLLGDYIMNMLDIYFRFMGFTNQQTNISCWQTSPLGGTAAIAG